LTNYIKEYYAQIADKKIIVSKRVEKVYKDLAEKIDNPTKYHFEATLAERPIKFIERYCKHSKGEYAGKPVILELFQKAFIQAIFGFVDDQNLRQYREALFLCGRKNGKSTLASAISLYMLSSDGESGAEVYTTATKYQQAKIIFDEVLNMVKQDSVLSAKFHKRKNDLLYKPNFSKMQPLAKNSNTLDGLNASLVLIDELHGITDRNMYEVLKQSQTARRQPLLLMLTTAGTTRANIFDEMYEFAADIADDKKKDEKFLPIMYELDSRDEWQNPQAWQKANPALGTVKKIDTLSAEVDRAKQNPTELSGLLCKHFNIRETNKSAWLSFDALNNTETFDLGDFSNNYYIGGVDLSITTDLTCASILTMRPNSDKKYITQMYFLPEDRVTEHIQTDKIPYDVWQKQGLIRFCQGNTINYSDVTAWFLEITHKYQLQPAWIYYDSYSARYFVDEMAQNGFIMVRCIQGAKTLSIPMQMLGADLANKKVIYNNNQILKWCLSNTDVMTDRNGNIVPIKSQNPKQRIDGTAALLDCYVGLYEHLQEFTEAIKI